MPAKSGKQLRAMYAAASGKSKLGIPAKVGKEFVRTTPRARQAAMMLHHRKSAKGFRRRQREGYE